MFLFAVYFTKYYTKTKQKQKQKTKKQRCSLKDSGDYVLVFPPCPFNRNGWRKTYLNYDWTIFMNAFLCTLLHFTGIVPILFMLLYALICSSQFITNNKDINTSTFSNRSSQYKFNVTWCNMHISLYSAHLHKNVFFILHPHSYSAQHVYVNIFPTLHTWFHFK